jgi:hypothetical protein
MNAKVLIAIAAVLVVAGGTYWWVSGHGSPINSAPSTYSWSFKDKTLDQSQPRTEVTLVTDRKSYTIGTYDGSCAEQDTDLMPNEKIKAVCWFAGGGKEIGLFDENGSWSVKVGDVDEGSAETGGFRGNFQTTVSL